MYMKYGVMRRQMVAGKLEYLSQVTHGLEILTPSDLANSMQRRF